MSQTLTIRLPDELAEKLEEKARITGLSKSAIVREELENSLQPGKGQPWMKLAGKIKGAPPKLSGLKGYNR